MPLILRYQQGSFAQWETMGSLTDAIERAYELILSDKGCSGVQIEQDGRFLMGEAQIVEKCRSESTS